MTRSVADVVAQASFADRRARIGRATTKNSSPRPKRHQWGGIGVRRDALYALMILSALEQTQAIIGIANGRIVHWSQGAEWLYGWTAKEAIGSCVHDLLKQINTDASQASAAELDRCGIWKGAFSRSHKNGRELAVAAHCILRRDPSGQATVIELDNLMIDPAERSADPRPTRVRQTEANGCPNRRMAHDFNNLLGIITLNLELARERAGTGLRDMMDEALNAAWQASELTRLLADFGRH